MDQEKGQITIWLSISIILLSAGLVCHVLSVPAILDVAGRDGWLSVLAAAPLFMLFLGMMYIIIRRIRGQRLTDWITREFGVVPSWIFRITAVLLLFSLGTHTLYETTNWTVSTYLPFTPTYVLAGGGALVLCLVSDQRHSFDCNDIQYFITSGHSAWLLCYVSQYEIQRLQSALPHYGTWLDSRHPRNDLLSSGTHGDLGVDALST